MASRDFPNDILSGSADEAAIGLLGCLLIREFDDGGIAAARIVETEAYDQFANRSGRRTTVGSRKDVDLTNGPAKLCQAMGIDLKLYGHDLSTAPLYLERNALLEGERIAASPRIGISKAAERLRRFFIMDNPYVTKSPLNRRNTLLAG